MGNIRSMGTRQWREYTDFVINLLHLVINFIPTCCTEMMLVLASQDINNNETPRGAQSLKKTNQYVEGGGGGGREVKGRGIILQSWQLCELIQCRIQRRVGYYMLDRDKIILSRFKNNWADSLSCLIFVYCFVIKLVIRFSTMSLYILLFSFHLH